MKHSVSRMVALILRGAVPAAAVAAGVCSPPAWSGPGDLDPTFGDVGRLGPILSLEGPVWSLNPLSGDETFFAGGEACLGFYCDYYSYYTDSTAVLGRLSNTGTLDPNFAAPTLRDTEVLDVAMQPDGMAVAVGFSTLGSARTAPRLTVFRLETDGSLDLAFGMEGIVKFTESSTGSSVVLDTEGRIVVAGQQGGRLVVARMHSDGTSDDAFGTMGVFRGPETDDLRGARIVAGDNGGYRVATNFGQHCRVIGLTSDGAVDENYGNAGDANLGFPADDTPYCRAMERQDDGQVLVGGSAMTGQFVVRLATSGEPDPGFTLDAVHAGMSDVRALAVKDDGSILVGGGSTVSSAAVMQLQANGELDILFGNAGTTSIELASELGAYPFVDSVAALADGRVLVAGGAYEGRRHPFVVRLLGDSGGDSPGVVGVVEGSINANEGDVATVTVRRTGGHTGSVSVGYRTTVDPYSGIGATAGEDYTEVSGRLTWADGDSADQTITVPIPANESPEEVETFFVTLDDPQGNAGVATRHETVNIQPDGAPSGQFSVFFNNGPTVTEAGIAQVTVSRNYYFGGAVSVTLTAIAGSASAGDDFTASTQTLTWGDGVSDPIVVDIPIVDDGDEEGAEDFSVELSAPTGGAILGPHTAASISIDANDHPPPPPVSRPSGGGGAFDWLSMVLFAPLLLFRMARRLRVE